MNNVVVRVYRGELRLEAGFAKREDAELLLEGIAQLSSPSRAWERAAALEGMFDAALYLHAPVDLSQADWAEVEHTDGRTRLWRVVSHSNSNYEWRLNLAAREVT